MTEDPEDDEQWGEPITPEEVDFVAYDENGNPLEDYQTVAYRLWKKLQQPDPPDD